MSQQQKKDQIKLREKHWTILSSFFSPNALPGFPASPLPLTKVERYSEKKLPGHWPTTPYTDANLTLLPHIHGH